MPLPTPAINDSEGVDELAGAATVTYSTGSSPFTVRTSGDQPAQVGVDSSGQVSVDRVVLGIKHLEDVRHCGSFALGEATAILQLRRVH